MPEPVLGAPPRQATASQHPRRQLGRMQRWHSTVRPQLRLYAVSTLGCTLNARTHHHHHCCRQHHHEQPQPQTAFPRSSFNGMRSLKFLVITGASDPDEFGSMPFEQKAPKLNFFKFITHVQVASGSSWKVLLRQCDGMDRDGEYFPV